jgi:hypothetical protein
VPVRLLSLLPVDLPPSADTGAIRLAARRDRRGARRGAGGLPGGLHTDVAVAAGDSIEDAVSTSTGG